MNTFELTTDLRQIISCVEENSGCNIEKVVTLMRGSCGRNAVRNNVKVLIKKKLIIAQKGRQVYRLYVNKDNLLASIVMEVTRFDSVFSTLSDRVKTEIRDLEQKRNAHRPNQDDPQDSIENELIHATIYVYRCFVYGCEILIATKLQSIKYDETLKRIQRVETSVKRIQWLVTAVKQDMQTKLLDTILGAFSSRINRNREYLARLVIEYPFDVDVESFYLLRGIFTTNKMTTEFEQVMNSLWPLFSGFLGRPSMGFEYHNVINEVGDYEDWKKALDRVGTVFEDPQVVHARYQNKKMMFSLPIGGLKSY
ncbi:MAG: hypothetical protein ACRD47_12850 [Nitrososphaeraceae archaeon]